MPILSDEEFFGGGPSPAGKTARVLSDEEFFGVAPRAQDEGRRKPLSNAADDNWLASGAKSLGTAAVRGLSSLPGTVGSLADFVDYGLAAAEGAITGRPRGDVYRDIKKRVEERQPWWAPTRLLPSGPDISEPILGVTGEYRPETAMGRVAQSGMEAIFGGAGLGAVTKGASLPKALFGVPAMTAPGNFIAGGTGQAAIDAGLDPILAMGIGVGSAGLAEAAGRGAGAVGNGIGDAWRGAPPDAAIGDRLRRLSTDPNRVERALFPGPELPGAPPNFELVPGSKPTVPVIADDIGLHREMRRLGDIDDPSIAAAIKRREGEQNAARRAAVEGLSVESDALAVPEAARGVRARVEAADQAMIDEMARRASAAREIAGPGTTPEARGSDIRSAVEGEYRPARARVREAYRAVDPEGELNIVAAPVRDAARQIAGSVGEYAAPIAGDEARLLGLAANAPEVMRYSDLLDLDAGISGAMRQAKRDGDNVSHARLIQLKGAVQDAIANAPENQAAYLARAREEALGDRTYEVAVGGDVMPEPPPPPASPDVYGAPGDWRGPPAAPSREPPKSLERMFPTVNERKLPRVSTAPDYLKQAGGIDEADLSRYAGKDYVASLRQRYPGLIKKPGEGGMKLDEARRVLAEGAYLDADVSRGVAQSRIDDALDAIDNSSVSYRDDALVQQRDDALAYNEEQRGLRESARHIVDENAKTGGAAPDSDLLREAAELHYRAGIDWDTALEQAAVNQYNRSSENTAAIPDYAPPGIPSKDRRGISQSRGTGDDAAGQGQGASPRGGFRQPGSAGREEISAWAERGQPLEPNVDETAAGRIRAAKGAHREMARTYREGPVAPVLKTRGFADNYDLPDSAVPSRAVVKGDRGYETLRAYLRATKNSPAMVAAAGDHLLADLRGKIGADGSIRPAALEAWKRVYAPALRAMDEVSPGFSRRFDTAAAATDELVRLGAARKAAIDAFQKSEAAKFLGKTQPVEVENQLGLILSAKQNGPTRMRDLVRQIGGNRAALDGLRASGIDWIMRTFSNSADAAGTGERTFSSARFQKFVAENRATLLHLYPKEQVDTFAAVANDLRRADTATAAVRNKNNPSGSALSAISGLSEKVNRLSQVSPTTAAALVGTTTVGSTGSLTGGLVAGAGAAVLSYLGELRNKVRSAGDAMVLDALMNPERARYYWSQSKKPAEAMVGLSRSIRRQLIVGPAIAQKDEKNKR